MRLKIDNKSKIRTFWDLEVQVQNLNKDDIDISSTTLPTKEYGTYMCHGSSPPPPILEWDLKISDQNNWEGGGGWAKN